MRDLAIIAFLGGLLALGLRRPFLFTLAYIYVDTVSPHRLSYYLLNSVPVSLIVAVAAIGGWAVMDSKQGARFTVRQGLMLLLLLLFWWTTGHAAVPVEAQLKWDWAWKVMVFAVFLPLTLRTKLRIEAALLFLTLSAAVIIITGGIKTVLGGGGYGQLALLVDSNSGLYESSTISAIAIALIPIILWFARHGTIFPPDWRVKLFCAGLVLACLLMPVGTEARTGLVCIAVLGVLMLRGVRNRALYLGVVAFLGLASLPLLPQSFQERMGLIQGYQQDDSATTRLAVWQWTLDYVQDNPLGGGFGAYHINQLQVQTVATHSSGAMQVVQAQGQLDQGRAWHSAYFEMLGEQGWPGLFLFLLIHGICLARLEILRRRYLRQEGDDGWIAPLATALQHFQIIYLVGALFIAVAVQPFAWLMVGCMIGFDSYVRRLEQEKRAAGAAFPGALPQPQPSQA